MTRLRILLVPAALLFACGKSTPCTGSKCPDVAGEYLVTYNPSLDCPDWAYQAPPTSSMTVSQQGSAVELDVMPSSLSPAHVFHATVDAQGSVSATEPAPDARLGLHYGQLAGAFTGGVFQGTLTLQISGVPQDGGAGHNCSGPYTVAAQRTSGGPADGGSGDGGNADAGDGG